MGWRQLANEAEIIALLKPLGFVAIAPEELTFIEQVHLFQQAHWIVAPNGSALNNLIFSDPGVQVMVLIQENAFHNWGGWLGPMMILGFAPRFVTGHHAAVSHQSVAGEKHGDYYIPPEKILSVLKEQAQMILQQVTD